MLEIILGIITIILFIFIIMFIHNIDKNVVTLTNNINNNSLDKKSLECKEDDYDEGISEEIKEEKYTLKLINFSTHMVRWREFLNQSEYHKKSIAISSISAIDATDDIESSKIYYLQTFTELILENNLSFSDLDITTDYYDYGPLEAKSIWFDIGKIVKTKDGSDYKVFEADIVFTLSDKSKKSLKWEFFDNTIEEFDRDYNQFQYIDVERDAKPYKYIESYNKGGKYRIVLNDLFQYIEFVGRNYLNKTFIENSFLHYKFETAFEDIKCIHNKWLIDENYVFKYVDDDNKDLAKRTEELEKSEFESIDKLSKDEIIDEISVTKEELLVTSDELFKYCLFLYYKEYSSYKLKEKIFKVSEYLDVLITNRYPLAYIVKAILHLDGKVVLKDTEEAKRLLREAYNLGLQTPSMMIWNENGLDS